MTSTPGLSGRGKLGLALLAALLAVAGPTVAAAPAHAESELVETTLSMTADPEVPGSAILHAELTGAYVAGGGAIPAGTWSFAVADDSGATLFAQEVAQPADGPTSVEVVWPGVPSGILASGVVIYVPNDPAGPLEFAGATASFETPEAPENTTGATSARQAPSTTEAAPAERAPEPLTVMLGVLVAACLLVASVGIVLLVRRDRRTAGGRM